jgi:hypothetical protein
MRLVQMRLSPNLEIEKILLRVSKFNQVFRTETLLLIRCSFNERFQLLTFVQFGLKFLILYIKTFLTKHSQKMGGFNFSWFGKFKFLFVLLFLLKISNCQDIDEIFDPVLTNTTFNCTLKARLFWKIKSTCHTNKTV